MKVLRLLCTLLILFTIQTTSYGFTYNTSSNNSYRSTSLYLEPSRSGVTYGQPVQNAYSTPRIGYSTYRGTYQPKYNSNYISGTNPIGEYNSNYNSGSGNSGRPGGQPRRVVIRSGNDSIDTGRQDDYNPDWNYYHGRIFGGWYYDDGEKVWKWNGEEWEETSWIVEWGSKNADAHPSVPIGDPPVYIMLGLLFLYIGYDTLVKPRLKK